MTDLLVPALLAPFILAFAVASFRSPLRIALPVYAFLLPYGSGLSLGVGTSFGSLSSLMGLLLTAALAAQLVTSHQGAPRLQAPVPIWLAFVGVAGASLLWSIAPGMTVSGWLVLASQTTLFALLALSRVDPPVLRRFETAVVAGALVSVLWGLAQLLLLGGLPSDSGTGRFGNGLLGPNNQAASLLLPLAITVTRWAAGHGRRARYGNALASALLVIGIVMTGSRGGLLAMAVTLAVVVVAYPGGRRRLLVASGAVTAVIVLMLTLNPAGLGERQLNQQGSSSGRAEIWSVGLHACPQYCGVGAGWGTFARVYETERSDVPDLRVLRRGTAYEAHSIWLMAAIEVGLTGLVLLAAGLAVTFLDALRLPAAARAAPLAALCGTVFAGFFLSNLEYKFFWMVLAYVAMSRSSADLPGSVSPQRAGTAPQTARKVTTP